jgi:SAM-dependent methyltransferase
MASAGTRVRQLLLRHPVDLLWLGYVLAVAPWLHRAAAPLHQLLRWIVRHRRDRNVDPRIERLRVRITDELLSRAGYRIALAELCPPLEEICRPLRRPNEEIAIATIDQDGFLCPRFEHLWAAPRVHAEGFLPRSRFQLTVVDRDGWVGVHKDFRGNKVAFANELEAALDLAAGGCPTAPILAVDFARPSITFAYVHGTVVREALAEAGAPMRDRDLRARRSLTRNGKVQRERRKVGRQLIGKVLGEDATVRIGDAMLAIHHAGYTFEDVKYGNIIIEAATGAPYFVDYERALPLRHMPHATATYLRDRDAEKLNTLFGTDLLTARRLRRIRRPVGIGVYSPLYAGAGIWWGKIWNPDLGMLRWRHMLANNLPIPNGGRILDLGANNGFNALQMLRAGAAEAIGVEIDPAAIEQGLFVKRVFEWADNTEYRFSYICGSHANVGSMGLGRFDLVTAFCTLYYLSAAEMARTVSDLLQITDTLVLQCNDERSIRRNQAETYEKASLAFNVELVRKNGFSNVRVVARRGSNRPLVIARRT